MADSSFGPKTLKRKNVKGLSLGAGAPAAPAKPTQNHDDDQLSNQFSTLEIGVEFKLDLRAEDLQVIQELGAGNGGTVSKVMHVATKKIMAKKVLFNYSQSRMFLSINSLLVIRLSMSMQSPQSENRF